MAKFLPSIISVLDNYVTVGVSPEIHVLSAEVFNFNFTVYVIEGFEKFLNFKLSLIYSNNVENKNF